MIIDERLERLTDCHEASTMTGELVSRDIKKLLKITRRDNKHILALARIAEPHERRLERIEGVQ